MAFDRIESSKTHNPKEILRKRRIGGRNILCALFVWSVARAIFLIFFLDPYWLANHIFSSEMEAVAHYTSLIKQAKEAEEKGNLNTATELYEKAIKQKPLLEQPYARLMVIYRKAKEYKKELSVIEKGLDVFTKVYDKKKQSANDAKIARLSKAILKSLGAKADDANNYPEPIGKWLKRKAVVEKKTST